MAERIPILVYHRVHHPDDVTVANDGGRVDLPGINVARYLSFDAFREIVDEAM